MLHGAPTTKDAELAALSPLLLRFGVALIILWLIPFWALWKLSRRSLAMARPLPRLPTRRERSDKAEVSGSSPLWPTLAGCRWLT